MPGTESLHEKNWIAFADGGVRHYVYAVFPHTVVTAGASGECLPMRYVDRGSSAVHAALESLAAVEQPVETAVFVVAQPTAPAF